MRGFLNSKANIKVDPNEPGLVCGLDMKQDIAGKVFDKSGNGVGVDMVGNPRQGQDSIGSFLEFNGGSDNLLVDGYTIPASTPSMYSFWLNISDTAADSRYLFDAGDGSNRIVLAWRTTHNTGKIGMYDGAWREAGDGPTINAVHHLVFYLDGAGLFRLYIDGELLGSAVAYTPQAITSSSIIRYMTLNTGTPDYAVEGKLYNTQIIDATGKSVSDVATWAANQYALGKRALWMSQPVNNTGTVTSGQIGDSPFRVESGGFKVVDRLIGEVVLGGDAITNGDFANWTGDDPDDWIVTGETGTSYATEDALGCKLVSDGSNISFRQGSLSEGKMFRIEFDCTEYTSGSVRCEGTAGIYIGNISSAGSYSVDIISDSDIIRFIRNTACDLVINNVVVKPIRGDMKAIECITPGRCYVPTSIFQQTPAEAAHGGFDFWWSKADASNMFIWFISQSLDSITTNAYNFLHRSSEEIDLQFEGSTTIINGGSTQYAADTWHHGLIARKPGGEFDLYVNNILIGTGTENSVAESKYMVFDLDAGDKIGPIIKRLLP